MERNAIQEYIAIVGVEEASLKQKACDNRIALGDENNSYFHRSVKARFSKNRILMLLNEQGVEVTDNDQIKEVMLDSFSKLLGEEHNDMYREDLLSAVDFEKIDDVEAADMSSEVQAIEIVNAMFSIDDAKAPGPDGEDA
ncbi:hypothetical protein FRX31_004366 [Thalictrum thalictroides]|uniref:Uncharacterized protein n=1 Tax=Thalictrum thalictroides TaxID=46969 RepID=A0A7J6XAU0_THATH|nr:hypothetical protein FRX31_004366 [Thalictrum thalictroides]